MNLPPPLPLALLVAVFFPTWGPAQDLRSTGTGLNAAMTIDGLAVELRPEIYDRTGGTWHRVNPGEASVTQEGSAFASTARYRAAGGEFAAELTVEPASPPAQEVHFKWSEDAVGPGFGLVALWLPEEEANQVSVLLDGKVAFADWQLRNPIRKEVTRIELQRTGAAETLLQIEPTGTHLARVEVFFESNRPDRGLSVRVFSVDDPNTSELSDERQVSFHLLRP